MTGAMIGGDEPNGQIPRPGEGSRRLLLAMGPWLLAVTAFVLNTCRILRPVRMGTGGSPRLLGEGVDLLGTIWTYDTVLRMLEGRASAFNPMVFAPVGWDQGAAQAYAWLDAVLAWPLMKALGIPGFYNVHLLCVLMAGQLVLYLVFREARAPWPLAAGLAMAAMASPFVLDEIGGGRPTQVHWLFHGLHLLCILRLLRPERRMRARLADAALAGLCLAAACYVYWFGAIALALLTGSVLAFHLACEREGRGELLRALFVMGIVAFLLAVLPVWRLAAPVLMGGGASWIADLADPPSWKIALGSLSLLLRGQPRPPFASITGLVGAFREVGWSLPWLGVGLIVGFLPGRRHRVWWAASALLLSLPFGPMITVGDHVLVTIAGLAQIIFPPMARCHFPGRMVVAPLLGLGVAMSLAAGEMWRRGGRARVPVVGLGLVVALGIPLGRTPLSTTSFEGADIYVEAARLWPGGMIHVPLFKSNEEYAWQVIHRQPLLGGPGIRGNQTRPAAHLSWCAGNTFLQALEELAREDQGPLPNYDEADLARLVESGFRVVVVHRQFVRSPLPRISAFMGGSPLDKGMLAVWPLPGTDSVHSPNVSP